MKLVVIGIQGGKGSFSEDAAEEFVKNHGIEELMLKLLLLNLCQVRMKHHP